jgi:hypothetical protein
MSTKAIVLLTALCAIAAPGVFAEVTTANVDSFHLASPFWKCDTSYDEGITFIKPQGAALADAKLLFKPAKVLLVRNAPRTTTYAYGTDFTIDTVGKRIILTANSRIPWGPLPGGEGHDNHMKQAIVTYTHTDTWPAPVGQYAGSSLPITIGKLANKQPVTFAIMGTSISVGFNVSGYECFAGATTSPSQPSGGWLLAALLRYRYGSTITFKNHGISTVTSATGVQIAQTVANEHPDLVILEYGMNECSEPSATYKANIMSIMSTIKGINPATEFIIEGSTLPVYNRDRCYDSLPAKRASVLPLCGPGVVYSDVTKLWADILQRKRYEDMTGNNVNHPNDWGHRLLAQAPMELLWSPGTPADARSSKTPPCAVRRIAFSSGAVMLIGRAQSPSSLRQPNAGIGAYDIRGRLVTPLAGGYFIKGSPGRIASGAQ